MKYIKSKRVGPKSYELTIQVSDYDLEMVEDLAMTYDPFQEYQDKKETLDYDFELPNLYFTEKYKKWLDKTWRVFWTVWHKHDK